MMEVNDKKAMMPGAMKAPRDEMVSGVAKASRSEVMALEVAMLEGGIVRRPTYLRRLEGFIDKPLVKILVGMRRVGKSSLLKQVKGLLLERGVREDQIIEANFESLEYARVRTREEFIDLAREWTREDKRYYIMLDEVQLVEGWEEVVNGLLADGKADIYVTGSNSRLLSSEISTHLTGRYVNIYVQGLSFREALEFKAARGLRRGSLRREFQEYLGKGGFPILHALDYTREDGDKAVMDIYTSIIYRDLIERKGVRNTELLGRVVKYLFDNVGNVFSAKSVADYLKSEMRKLDPETVYNYLNWLEEVFVVRRVPRYDLRGKALLKTQEKYYLGDVGLLYALVGRRESHLPGVLENLVYLELVARGYEVYIGKNGEREVDFVAERKGERVYLQVAAHLYGEETRAREFGAFEGVGDNYPRVVLCLDEGEDEVGGVRQIWLPRWLNSCDDVQSWQFSAFAR